MNAHSSRRAYHAARRDIDWSAERSARRASLLVAFIFGSCAGSVLTWCVFAVVGMLAR